MFDDILVPTDGSECAGVATDYAEDLAARYGATVHVLCAVDPRPVENAPHYDDVVDDSSNLVEQTCSELVDTGLTAEPVIQTDVPHRAILSYAEEEGIDLIVMGTHGRTGVEHYLLGSVTEKVVRLSDVPVLTVTVRHDNGVTYPYSDILVPTDGSEGATAAISPAVNLATTYDARLHALSVVDTMAMGLEASSEIIFELLEEAAQTAVKEIERRASKSALSTVNTAVSYGSTYQEINSYVADEGIDLVVMGTRGRSGIERYLLGSVTEKVIRTSSVPVLTVRQSQ